MTTNAPKLCGSCLRGGNRVQAEWYVEGMRWNDDHSRRMPYRANVCADHRAGLFHDGGCEFTAERRVNAPRAQRPAAPIPAPVAAPVAGFDPADPHKAARSAALRRMLGLGE